MTITTNETSMKEKRSITDTSKQNELKQSYLSLQIITVFIFFIYFILNNLIKLQLKYHRLAIRKNKYAYRNNNSVEMNGVNEEEDDDDDDDDDDEDQSDDKIKHNYSFATSFSSSHYSSSINSSRSSKLKRIFKIILSKFSSSLLYFFYGYQYCQNTFLTDITSPRNINNSTTLDVDSNLIINDENSVRINILLTVFIVIATVLRVVIYHLRNYLLVNNEQHQQQVQKKKTNVIIFNDYNYILLFVGYNLSFFHVFSIDIAFKLSLTLFILLVSKHLLDYKQYKSVLFEIILLLICLNSYFHGYLNVNFNVFLFSSFLITFFYKKISFNCSCCCWCCRQSSPLSSIKNTSTTCLEILNKKFLCKNLKFHKFCILTTLILKLGLLAIIILVLIAKYQSFSLIIILPIFVILSIIWLLFNLLNVINLWLLMNKISECYKIAFDNAGINNRQQLVDNMDDEENTLDKIDSRENQQIKKTSFKDYFVKLFRSKLPVKIRVLNRIMAYKGIRYLATISHYIGVICFIQTLLLIIFVININSIIILNLFFIIISINLFWLNLIHELSSIISGTSIIYALVAPIDDSSSNRLTFLTSPINTTDTNGPSSSLPTYQNTYYQPSSYKQDIFNKRSTYLLNKLYKFINNHLIENYGCDYLTPSFSRASIETKLKAFFSKSTLDGPKYNTYIFYYCGPSLKTLSNQQQVCNLLLQDGTQLTIEDIISIWKEIHCSSQQTLQSQPHKRSNESIRYKNMPNKADTTDSDNEQSGVGYNGTISSHPNGKAVLTLKTTNSIASNSSRLILVIDAENTDLLLKYVERNLTQRNLFVALQTAVYFTPENLPKRKKNRGKGKKDSIKLSSNVGRFTIDWINYSCKSNYLPNEPIADNMVKLLDEENDDDDAFSDYENIFNTNPDEINNNEDSDDSKNINLNEMKKLKCHKIGKTNLKMNKYYECKYALSRNWTTYKFESNDLQEEMKQFWKL